MTADPRAAGAPQLDPRACLHPEQYRTTANLCTKCGHALWGAPRPDPRDRDVLLPVIAELRQRIADAANALDAWLDMTTPEAAGTVVAVRDDLVAALDLGRGLRALRGEPGPAWNALKIVPHTWVLEGSAWIHPDTLAALRPAPSQEGDNVD